MSIKGKRATVAVVVLDDHADPGDGFVLQGVTVEDSFEVKGDQSDFAVQLGDAAKTVSGRVRSLRPDFAAVRRADRPARPTNQEGPRLRLLMEGALTAAVHEVVHNTIIRNGKDCGTAFGSSKDDLDAKAETVYGGKYREATAAALSGLVGNRAPI